MRRQAMRRQAALAAKTRKRRTPKKELVEYLGELEQAKHLGRTRDYHVKATIHEWNERSLRVKGCFRGTSILFNVVRKAWVAWERHMYLSAIIIFYVVWDPDNNDYECRAINSGYYPFGSVDDVMSDITGRWERALLAKGAYPDVIVAIGSVTIVTRGLQETIKQETIKHGRSKTRHADTAHTFFMPQTRKRASATGSIRHRSKHAPRKKRRGPRRPKLPISGGRRVRRDTVSPRKKRCRPTSKIV